MPNSVGFAIFIVLQDNSFAQPGGKELKISKLFV